MELDVTGASEGKLKEMEPNNRKSSPMALKAIDTDDGSEYGPVKVEV
jgi:hypothetical protein